jgi:hypothetical protein
MGLGNGKDGGRPWVVLFQRWRSACHKPIPKTDGERSYRACIEGAERHLGGHAGMRSFRL